MAQILGLMALLLPGTSASCFGRDAHFKPGKAPVVVLPVRGDSTQVLVSWDQAVERPQCVDRYYVLVWADGSPVAEAARHVVNTTDPAKKQVLMTKTVTIEPCVTYKFAVELEELDKVSGKDLEKTREATFKSDGVASMASTIDPHMVKTSYLWDPVKKAVDLTKAVVRIPRRAIKNPSCLDYVQVTGAEVLSTRGPALTRGAPKALPGRGASGAHRNRVCQEESVTYLQRLKAEVHPGVLSWSACSLLCSLENKCTAWSWSRESAPGDAAGQCTTMQGFSGSSPHPHSVSGPRGCTSSSTSTQRGISPTLSVGVASTLPARGSYSSVAGGNSRRPSSLPSLAKPAFSNSLPRSRKGAARMVGPIKMSPPYLQPTIDITLPVEDCAGYMFHIQFYAKKKKLGEVGSVSLPPLADLPGYVPPPVTSVVQVAFRSGQPSYSLLPTSGVPLSCLPAYFEAQDAYAQRIENEATWLASEEERVRGLATSSQPLLAAAQGELLKAHGCTCTSPYLKLSTTDPNVVKKKEANQLGNYHFGGLHGSHPFYQRVPDTPASTTGRSSTKVEPAFLYFSPGKQQWVIGKSLGTTSGLFFGTAEKSKAKCPGDSVTRGTWQTATGSFGRWKPNPLVTVACQTQL